MEEDENIPYLTKEDETKIWDDFFTAVRRKKKQKRVKQLWTYTSIAAILLIVFSIAGYNMLFRPNIYVAKENNTLIILSDRSEVILQKDAKLTVEKSFPSNTREVHLEGDAVFKISKSKEHPFIVHGKAYETKVLGTVFKISQSGKTFSVDLYEGKVLVYKSEKPHEFFELKPKETFSNMGIAQVATVSITDKFDKSKAKQFPSLSFNECTLQNVVQVLEKTYGVNIAYSKELQNIKITIAGKNLSSKELLQTIALQTNLNLKEINDQTFELEK